LYRNNHWTPFGHPQLAVRYTLSPERRLFLLDHRSVGSEWLTERGVTIERGSLWYWLRNKHLYGELEKRLDELIIRNAPHTAEAAGLRLPDWDPQNNPRDFEYIITDEWIAQDPLERLKLGWMTVLVKAPVPIRTQLFKHKIGFCENESSRRYIKDPPSYFWPKKWRAKAPNVKQGSLKTGVKHPHVADFVAKSVYKLSDWGYRALLKLDVCPEQARFLLPQGMMTQWYWTGSLEAFVRAINLRTEAHAQEETWKIMQNIKQLMREQWPLTSRMTFGP
jgi:thymidylate synthase (FAD)